MSKWDINAHIVGKVYDLTQENMNLMIADIEKLKQENLRLKDTLSSIESSTFQWVMTKDNAADILLVLRPIRKKCREALKGE
jgi:hypothetical protein